MAQHEPFKPDNVTFSPRSRGRYVVIVNGVQQSGLVKKSQIAQTRMQLAHKHKPAAPKDIVPTQEPVKKVFGEVVIGWFHDWKRTEFYCPYCDKDYTRHGFYSEETECQHCGKTFVVNID